MSRSADPTNFDKFCPTIYLGATVTLVQEHKNFYSSLKERHKSFVVRTKRNEGPDALGILKFLPSFGDTENRSV